MTVSDNAAMASKPIIHLPGESMRDLTDIEVSKVVGGVVSTTPHYEETPPIAPTTGSGSGRGPSIGGGSGGIGGGSGILPPHNDSE